MSFKFSKEDNEKPEERAVFVKEVQKSSARIKRLILEIIEHGNVPDIFKNSKVVKEIVK